MAHAARLGELTEGLVTSITGNTKDDRHFQQLKDAVTKCFKEQSHARTNQFEVRDKLSGLSEKFSILNRDDLSEALQSRLNELPARSKWLPEILSLFLQLSDRPLEKTKLEDLNALPGAATPVVELTWNEIIADDPLDEDAIWENVDRGYHSSGDDVTDDDVESEPTTSTQATSLGDEDFAALAQQGLVQPDVSLLDDIRKQQSILRGGVDGSEETALSELSVIRETLNMLHGLPTYLFRIEAETAAVTVRPTVRLETAERVTVADALAQCASMGSALNSLRAWTRSEQEATHVRSMQAAAEKVLSNYNSRLAKIEQQYVESSADRVVSIIQVQADVEEMAGPLIHLSDAILQALGTDLPFALLDTMCSEACFAHMAGDKLTFEALSGVLLAGLQVYLRPIQSWLQSGALPTKEKSILFIDEAQADCDLGEVWDRRFAVRRQEDGKPWAPVFLRCFVDRIFALGKSQAFLNMLGESNELGNAATVSSQSNAFDSDDVHQRLQNNPFEPFDQILEQSLNDWLGSVGTDSTAALVKALLHDRGLLSATKALDYVYFGQDGLLFQAFSEALFDRLNRYKASWQDRFMLTEMAQDTIGTAPYAEANNIAVSAGVPGIGENLATSAMQQLQRLDLQYALSWPMQNITRSATLPVHAAAFALLLQVSYAKHLLEPRFLELRRYNVVAAGSSIARGQALKLGARLQCFADTLRAHITSTASISHGEMVSRLQRADGVDGMAAVWAAYEKRLQVGLLLAPNFRPIRDAVTGVLELCEHFTRAWKCDGDEAEDVKTQVDALTRDLTKSLSFIVAGLRGVSRAGGEAGLEILAEKLGWCGD